MTRGAGHGSGEGLGGHDELGAVCLSGITSVDRTSASEAKGTGRRARSVTPTRSKSRRDAHLPPTIRGVAPRPGSARSGDGAIALAPAPSFDLLESKLHVPVARAGIVARDGLVDRLDAATVPVVAVVAPPGYGKTTLLAQFAARKGTRAAWVSADSGDDDPFVLLSYILEAVARVAGPGSRVDGPPRLASVIAAMQEPMTLIIDHFESVTNWESWDVVAALALGLPPGSQLAIGSRDALPLPTALLRAQGGLLEVGIAELAMRARGGGGAALPSGRRAGRVGAGRPGRSHRGVADRPVPRRPRRAGRRIAGRRGEVHRRRPVHGRLLAVGAAGTGVERAGGLPHPVGDPRAHVRPAL